MGIAPHPHHQLKFPHYPLLCTITLASLVKGEVLSPEKIRATTGGIASRCTECCYSHNLLKSTTAFPHTNPPKTALSLENCQRTCLPSKKGRWLDGKAQTVALLLSACNMPNLFIMQTFLPSRRRDCSAIFHSEPTLPKPHYP